MLCLSLPPSKLYWIVWFAYLPILWVISRSSITESLIYGLICGAVYYSLSFQWTYAFQPYALAFVSILQGLLFVAFPLVIIRFLLRFPVWSLFSVPSIWVFFEYLKQVWFLKFPFGIIGYSQYYWPRLIQIADITGVWGISWIIVFINLLLFRILTIILSGESKKKTRALFIYPAMIIAVFGLLLVYGSVRAALLQYNPHTSLKVGFAQTLFHPKKKWHDHWEEYLSIIEDQFQKLSGLDADLVLFPELTVERYLTLDRAIRIESNAEILNRLSKLARQSNAALLFGGIELKQQNKQIEKYNTTFLFSKTGDLSGLYRKQVLVPFGEFYPFGNFLPGLKTYISETTDAAELMPGHNQTVFSVRNRKNENLTFGVLTCFESGFGSLARRYAQKDVDFLVNVTNDYWSLSSIAMVQHAVMSVFRAIETRRPVLRISNGGFSCYVDEIGKYSSTIPLFRKGLMTARLRLLATPGRTAYTLLGDWFVLLCLLIVLSYPLILVLRKAGK